ncbi:hypothetical protein N9C70_02160 [Flavobacteriales bacterium]|nr:hypothetical protein [Flavobacteriales bacterium]
MRLIEVQDEKTRKAFHVVPRRIYADDPAWIPHLKQDVDKVFDPKGNRLFKKGGKVKRWLAQDESGQWIGRVAAFVNPKYSKGMEQPTGGVGFFESTDDDAVAAMLLDAAEEWLKSEGMEAVDGPINFGEKDKFWGLLVDNFVDIPSYGMNYNRSYYERFFKSRGYQVYYEQFVYGREVKLGVQAPFERKRAQIEARGGYRVITANDLTEAQLADHFCTVYNNAWGGHHGFTKMPLKQAQRTVQTLKPVMDKDIIFFVLHEKNPVAFYVNIPELNQIFRHVNGNLNVWGKMKFLYHKWRGSADIMVGLVFGIDRAYHGQGLDGLLIDTAGKQMQAKGRYKTTTLTWIGDFNPKMIRIAENLGTERIRTFQTLRKLFDPEQPFKRVPIAK